jgi:2-polyprenyl-3-methyl-5-hydroxy-6-metoxy-1,4-benzoquinol methylase
MKAIGMDEIKNKVQLRYGNESQNESNLSCGNNLCFLELKPGDRILDLGCGRGLNVLPYRGLAGLATVCAVRDIDMIKAE